MGGANSAFSFITTYCSESLRSVWTHKARSHYTQLFYSSFLKIFIKAQVVNERAKVYLFYFVLEKRMNELAGGAAAGFSL